MVLLKSTLLPMGTGAPNFNLPSTDDKTYSLSDFNDKKALVIVFMCNHCPYVQAIIDRLVFLQADYAERGVQVIGINPNDSNGYPEDSFVAMKELVSEKEINFIYLRDKSQEVAKLYQAQCTPDIFVFDQNKKLAYHGRLDDNWQSESDVTTTDLRDALGLLLAGEKVDEDQAPCMGCSIKWI